MNNSSIFILMTKLFMKERRKFAARTSKECIMVANLFIKTLLLYLYLETKMRSVNNSTLLRKLVFEEKGSLLCNVAFLHQLFFEIFNL